MIEWFNLIYLEKIEVKWIYRWAKLKTCSSGRTRGGGRYGVGALAHFLKNRFYIGEVVYRGEVHAGEQEPILDRTTFDAVQAKLAEIARSRRVRIDRSPAILMGRVFDDRGNRMTPSHCNKAGVRFRYYVSHALLQRRKDQAGGVARVPAIQVEAIVVEAVRGRMQQVAPAQGHCDLSDREVIDRHVKRVVVNPQSIDVQLLAAGASGASQTYDRPEQVVPRRPSSSACRGKRPRPFP
jgi:site-specific DNA recombinase